MPKPELKKVEKTPNLKQVNVDQLDLQIILSNVEQQKSRYYASAGRTQSILEGTITYLLGIIGQKEQTIIKLEKISANINKDVKPEKKA